MGVSYFSCDNCGNATSEYDQVYCHNCERTMCSCAMPDEIHKLCGCWEDVWNYVTTDKDDNIVKNPNCEEDYSGLFNKYLIYNTYRYGLELKEEFCPLCNKDKKYMNDPEYKEYLKLKAKFDK